jgi:hypothetical protein
LPGSRRRRRAGAPRRSWRSSPDRPPGAGPAKRKRRATARRWPRRQHPGLAESAPMSVRTASIWPHDAGDFLWGDGVR